MRPGAGRSGASLAACSGGLQAAGNEQLGHNDLNSSLQTQRFHQQGDEERYVLLRQSARGTLGAVMFTGRRDAIRLLRPAKYSVGAQRAAPVPALSP